jgi:hypothetical protein
MKKSLEQMMQECIDMKKQADAQQEETTRLSRAVEVPFEQRQQDTDVQVTKNTLVRSLVDHAWRLLGQGISPL